MLKTLIENRAKAVAAYEAFVSPIIAESRSLTEDETTKRTELRSVIDTLDTEIDAAEAEVTRSAKIAETRARAGLNAPESRGDDVHVNSEPTTYGPAARNSYYRDLILAAPEMRSVGGHEDAISRLAKHRTEMAGTVRTNPNTAESRALIRADRESRRGSEQRAVDTGANDMGSFAPPVYLLSDFAPYKLPGRAFASACRQMDLPDTGMSVSVPKINTAAETAVQASQNTGLTEQDPTSNYVTSAVQTVAGNVNASQQYLDRVGPGVAGDMIIQDALQRSLNQQMDAIAINAAVANATQVTYSSWSAGTGVEFVDGLYSALGSAVAGIETAPGSITSATHVFSDPKLAAYVKTRTDSTGRPLFIDQGVAMNPMAVGNDANAFEGASGFNLLGIPWYKDGNIDLEGNNLSTPIPTHQVIVGDLSTVYFMQGTPQPRVLPQPYAANLTVLLQLYCYVAVLVLYPNAIAQITGSSLEDSGLTF